MDETESGYGARVSAYAAVGARLSLLSDRRLEDAVASAPSLGSGIGGRSAEMEIEGIRVFVKRVPLTDIEVRPEHVRSTRNLFDLPLFYQYGAGSAGFGAWRELAAHVMTTGWVLRNEYAGFPLLYHWRILPDSAPAGFADGLGGVEGAVAHWEGSPAVRRRLEAIGRSSFSLVLFLEHVPQTLAAWLGNTRDAARPEQGGESPYRWVEDQLLRGTEFMSARGLVHFDAHFANLLTDGRQVYFADFGLASSRDFELSAEERVFLTEHLVYDRSYAPNHLLRHHLPDGVRGGSDHGAFLRDWLEGRRPVHVPPEIGGILDRHAPHAMVLDDFHHRLLTQSKLTPFPAAEVERALDGDSES
ncbi:protein kinase family protein [Streptomyces sp. NBC_00638]|uniref:protein kinase family protein n=1 Tax=Streptomyces sp. NBC_00638 TaxID=2975794 RepID=UPI00225574EB|nr:protein kinase family protein [Streptomyces sp. NBC_00638]MCX5008985.1 protein kinase family protein [Streptomyces sp. NBC_00638]